MTQPIKTTALVIGALAIAFGLSLGVNAADRSGRPVPPSFSEIDENSDQLISREEIEAAMQAMGRDRRGRADSDGDRPDRFARIDTDGDGYINESEFAVAREKMQDRRARHHKQRDCDGEDDSV